MPLVFVILERISLTEEAWKFIVYLLIVGFVQVPLLLRWLTRPGMLEGFRTSHDTGT